MGKFTSIKDVKLPDLNVVYKVGKTNYGSEIEKARNTATLQMIKQKYGAYVDKWANVFELPTEFVIAFIAVESGGEMVGRNPFGATGLMQLVEVSVREAVSRFKLVCGTPLPTEAISYLSDKAPYLLKLTPNQQTLSAANTSDLEKKMKDSAEFNIMLGCLVLRYALEFTKGAGYTHLNKAIMGYNQSLYGDIARYKGKDVSTITLFKDKGFPKETRDYLAKTLGFHGFLHLYAKENL
jgi:hypothetical protein